MKTPKTLKQITSPCSSTDREKPEGYCGENFYGVATGEAIRLLMKQEGMRWIDYITKYSKGYEHYDGDEVEAIVGFIMDFFNLSNKDFKYTKYKKVYLGHKEL